MLPRRVLEHPAQVALPAFADSLLHSPALPAFADSLLHSPALTAFDEVGVPAQHRKPERQTRVSDLVKGSAVAAIRVAGQRARSPLAAAQNRARSLFGCLTRHAVSFMAQNR